MKTVLTIAGTDPTGGAGLHADLKTFCAHGVYGMGVVTAVVAQNTSGVIGYDIVSPSLLAAQLDAVFSDIFPNAIKIGMLADIDSIETVATSLEKWKAKRITLDPVMVSTSEHQLQKTDAAEVMAERLFPLCELITPNLEEAQKICGFQVQDRNDMERAAQAIQVKHGIPVLITGGHLGNTCDDLYCDTEGLIWIPGEHVQTTNTHGTGCTLAASIASNRALDMDRLQAIQKAKEFVREALSQGLDLGKGNGPLDHCSCPARGR